MKVLLRLTLVVALLCALICPAALADQEEIRHSVVRVIAEESDGYYLGSGFAVGERGKPVRYFVTNRHMVEGANSLYITVGMSDDRIPAQVVDVIREGEGADLAVIVIDQSITDRSAATLRPFDVSNFVSSESVWAYGFPSDSDVLKYSNVGDMFSSYEKDMSCTQGNISRISQATFGGGGETIQHTAMISGGNSGGPLVDKNGQVIGVNYAGSNQTPLYLAVSINEVVRLLEKNGIPFVTSKDVRNNRILWIALAVVGVLVIVAVAVPLLKKSKPAPAQKMHRSLRCDEGALKGQRFDLGTSTGVGLDPKRCKIVFPSNTGGVSHLHVTITIVGDQVRVRDEHSSYGTWLDERKLTPGQDVVMHRGQKLYLGSKKQVLSLHS